MNWRELTSRNARNESNIADKRERERNCLLTQLSLPRRLENVIPAVYAATVQYSVRFQLQPFPPVKETLQVARISLPISFVCVVAARTARPTWSWTVKSSSGTVAVSRRRASASIAVCSGYSQIKIYRRVAKRASWKRSIISRAQTDENDEENKQTNKEHRTARLVFFLLSACLYARCLKYGPDRTYNVVWRI